MPAVHVDVRPVLYEDGSPTEYLIWLAVPARGGEGILLGACHDEQAARTIAAALRAILPASNS